MNILGVIEREHAAMTAQLDQYVNTRDEECALLHARCAIARIDAYLGAEETTLFPALMMVSRFTAPLPHVHHELLQRRVADAISRDRRRDGTAWLRTMLKLQQETGHYLRQERNELCPQLRRMFTDAGLESLGAKMLRRLAMDSPYRDGVVETEAPAAPRGAAVDEPVWSLIEGSTRRCADWLRRQMRGNAR